MPINRLTLTTLVLVSFLIISSLPVVISSNSVSNRTIYVDDDGGADYKRIQDAIDNASEGDTVFVYSGTYFEDVKINTSIVLQGEDKERTIIHGGGFGSGDAVGTADSWITYKAAPGGSPTFTSSSSDVLDFPASTTPWYIVFDGLKVVVPIDKAGIKLRGVSHLKFQNMLVPIRKRLLRNVLQHFFILSMEQRVNGFPDRFTNGLQKHLWEASSYEFNRTKMFKKKMSILYGRKK